MDDRDTIDKLLRPQLLVIQIIIGAMIAGVVVFASAVLFAMPQNQLAPPANGQGLMLTYVALGVFAAALVLWAIVPNLVAGREVAKIAAGTWTAPANRGGQTLSYDTDTAKLLAVFQTRSIIAGAVVEGSAFLGTAAYMTQRQWPALAVAGAAVLLLLLTFPLRGRVESWLEKQQQTIDGLRQFGAPRP